ncbi:Dabb family protein [Sphingobacterium pedocola]|uniref:Stress responsive alpha-beta barrel domain-containing protein n=1 Tax=Sphingobacterium pedocola TaxID=2082722 RepID=A0ABR9TCX3_9SPHI|nr:Dabb family protein [Sphingobacterium pedocola]MBE8722914.1 stress responsive alpha-beta barrel domain-containing protein [Sphingobacterium pedocola]
MKRRHFINKSTASIAALTLTSVAAKANIATEKKDSIPGTIVHTVFFWLKEGLAEQDIQNFTGFFEELRKVPTVQSLHYGKPALTTPREVVDNSFSYNLIVTFANIDDINVYETHPFHLKAIEKYSHLWTKVKVSDTMLVA